MKCAGKTELLDYLLQQAGVEIDACDKYGCTPLMYAAMEGETKACCLLIAYGADYELKSPLHQKSALELFKNSSYKNFADELEAAIEERKSIICTRNNKSVTPEKVLDRTDSSSNYEMHQPSASVKKRIVSYLSTGRSEKQKSENDIALITPMSDTSKIENRRTNQPK